MPVHQNVNILHGLAGLNALQHVAVAKNHVIVNVIVQMDTHQIFVKTTANVMVSQERRKIVIRTLNVHQSVNSVRTGNHGCPVQKHVVVEPRVDKRNANARNWPITFLSHHYDSS